MNNAQTTTLEVQGMSCPSCIRHITAALEELGGVGNVDVKLRDGIVVVEHDDVQAPVAKMIAALETEGYTAKLAVRKPV